MKLRILSDLHLECSAFVPPKVECDVVVLAGDIWLGDQGIVWAREAFPTERIIYILGNHEAYRAELPETIEKCHHTAASRGVDFLEDSSVVFGDVRIVGATLWSDFSLAGGETERTLAMHAAEGSINDFRLIWEVDGRRRRRRLRAQDIINRHRISRRFITAELKKPFVGPTVVVTHFLPAPLSVSERLLGSPFNAYFCNDLTELIGQAQPEVWVHGHTHESCDYRIGRTRVVCNPRGYIPDEPNQNFVPDLVLEL